ncbi:permease [Geobacillus jurassicus]|uniref:Permease n=1 Tax=Geobacillus jurassicus TaxID=235932 RepID=A0ABV6GVM6_9BACL|nr:permease [Geobacillus jurassicus]
MNRNVRFGIVMVFLFASPVLDPTIITLMAVVLGGKVAAVYTMVTAVFSIVLGFLLEKMGFASQVKRVIVKGGMEFGKKKKKGVQAALSETLFLIKTVYPYVFIGAGIGAFIHSVVPRKEVINDESDQVGFCLF